MGHDTHVTLAAHVARPGCWLTGLDGDVLHQKKGAACVGSSLVSHVDCLILVISDLFFSQLLIVFASGYGQRPSLLDKLPPVEQIDSGASARQYHTNQM